MPINTVDGEGFRELINFLEPGYRIPSRGTITSRLEARYTERKGELKAQLASVNVALTTDCWTALTTESYITITCHYIAEDWQVKSAVLLTEIMSVRHTADNLAHKLNEAVESWGLAGRVIACVHDNAANIVAANNPTRVAWKSVTCFAHTLQLAINDGFGIYVYRVIVAAGKLVKHFHHSTPATKALEAKQQQMRLPTHRLIQSCKTRWNSVCEMFDRLVEQRWAVNAVLSDRTVTKLQDARVLELKDEYWQLMEDMAPVLAALKCATTVMSAETEVSISNTYPITFSLIDTHLMREEGDSSKVAEFKSKVRTSLGERIKVQSDDLTSTPAMIASMLDPRHKHLGFLTPVRRLAANAKLLELAAEVDVTTTDESSHATDSGDEGGSQAGAAVQEATPQSVRRASNAMLLLLGDHYSTRTNDTETEVDNFLKDIPPPLNSLGLHSFSMRGKRGGAESDAGSFSKKYRLRARIVHTPVRLREETACLHLV
ncbi:hypothetical protein SKAU_G00363700 [Synaphobranchus kaupii]|uniref:Uncharacterized protein n=1 Tax=Synaphobranchus kaupii TaxID=118154 RepID=A0A9Q1IHD1_SYNKA|nr:hypothetical protein SKAU_G00363700 [Synaphobranchus kaupii]